MLTRRKRLGIGKLILIFIFFLKATGAFEFLNLNSFSDSSPKSVINRNCLLISKKPATIITSLDFQTTPTRRRREQTRNTSGEDSPTLSQDPLAVTWRWNTENSPIRSPAASRIRNRKDKFRESPKPNLYRASIRSNTVSSSAGSSEPCSLDNESNSPKGLYKFQEEMKKIELLSFASSSPKATTSADNQRSFTATSESIRQANERNQPADNMCSSSTYYSINDSFKEDLLNDSDFDQVLSTCTEDIEKNLSQDLQRKNDQTMLNEQKSSAKLNNSSYMSFFNDESIDDMLGSLDDSIITSSINLNNSKLMRHKSMPQQREQTKPQTETKVTEKPKAEEKRNFQKIGQSATTNRKSLIRHESMPISATKRKSYNE